MRSLETVAVHEAAHAVAAKQVGFGPPRIELLENGGGTCWWDGDAGESLSASSAEARCDARRPAC